MNDYNVGCGGCYNTKKRSEAYHMADNSFRCEVCLLKEIARREAEIKAMKAWRPGA